MATFDPAQGDPFQLQRFVEAQKAAYATALAELRRGKKESHWMWYIFPQIAGLGFSSTSKRYAVSGPGEARAYLAHPVLGPRLAECTRTIVELRGRSAHEIFGSPDDMKLRSSLTLFAAVAEEPSLFARGLDVFFQGQRDARTLALLGDA